ncbi:MAG: hypothetical protein IPN47_07920 [Gemmatimonadetes bacterium]|nr:hypothetical protein [Gemmatimonadota bacterium]
MTLAFPPWLAAAWLAPAWLLGVALSLLRAARRRAAGVERVLPQAVYLGLLLVALLTPDGRVAFAMVALAGALLAWRVRETSATAALYIAISALSALVAAVGIWSAATPVAFAASMVGIALRSGLFPLHAGSAALAQRPTTWQLEQLAGLPVLVFVHVRFVDHLDWAYRAAPALVAYGGASMLLFAVVSLAARDLRRLYVSSTLMHGGMLCAAVGAAGRGHYGAAMLVAITMVLALAGFHTMLGALEARVGGSTIPDFAGRARAFPRLAASLAFFGGAAVGLPGTAGFVADDLLLHALWEESVVTAVVAIVASALLAVATLALFARAFFGPPQRHLAPDLLPAERHVAVLFIVFLLILGLVPGVLVAPVNALLQ